MAFRPYVRLILLTVCAVTLGATSSYSQARGAKPPERELLALCGRCPSPTVTAKSGIGTANPRAEAKMTQRAVLEIDGPCDGSTDKSCVQRETAKIYRATRIFTVGFAAWLIAECGGGVSGTYNGGNDSFMKSMTFKGDGKVDIVLINGIGGDSTYEVDGERCVSPPTATRMSLPRQPSYPGNPTLLDIGDCAPLPSISDAEVVPHASIGNRPGAAAVAFCAGAAARGPGPRR